MNPQNLSPGELQTCALLYTKANSVLFTTQTLLSISEAQFSFFSFNAGPNNDGIFQGTWYGKSFCIAPTTIIQSLYNKKLLMTQKEFEQEFYILNVYEEFKEFFKELEVQVALGSIL